MDPLALLARYFPNPQAFRVVAEHSRMVAAKATGIAVALDAPVDVRFVEEAALLHDIGICRIDAPRIDCYGSDPYITHGIHGRAILEAEELPRHALVCERHIGVGLTTEDIVAQRLPLPLRTMAPTTVEEEIVCFADLFYSKKTGNLFRERSIEAVRAGLRNFGEHKVRIFDGWLDRFAPFSP